MFIHEIFSKTNIGYAILLKFTVEIMQHNMKSGSLWYNA